MVVQKPIHWELYCLKVFLVLIKWNIIFHTHNGDISVSTAIKTLGKYNKH